MRYVVTLRFKFPAWDEREGIPYEVEADSKRRAIKEARRRAYNDGHTVGKPVTEVSFTAVEKQD